MTSLFIWQCINGEGDVIDEDSDGHGNYEDSVGDVDNDDDVFLNEESSPPCLLQYLPSPRSQM